MSFLLACLRCRLGDVRLVALIMRPFSGDGVGYAPFDGGGVGRSGKTKPQGE